MHNAGVPSRPPLFELESVTVRLGGTTVLEDLSLRLPDGGVTVLAGPSGAGKSTVLRLCNRLVVPSSGVVRFRGDDVARLDPVSLRRRVGMVFQRPTPFPGTVRDNLAEAARLDDAAAAELLALVALPADLLERDAERLSGGEAQRMCLARTLATGCEVVLADEITSSLDRDAAAEVERSVRGLVEGGRSVVWVTHDDDQARRVADHRVELGSGRGHH